MAKNQNVDLTALKPKDLPQIDISKSNIDLNNLPPLPGNITYTVGKAPMADIKLA